MCSASGVPTCFQPRSETDSDTATINSKLSAVLSDACASDNQQTAFNGALVTSYHVFCSFHFNITYVPSDYIPAPSPECVNIFRGIVDSCVKAPPPGFWGGWIIPSGSTNYSISDHVFPANALPSSMSQPGTIQASASLSPPKPSDGSSVIEGAGPSQSPSNAISGSQAAVPSYDSSFTSPSTNAIPSSQTAIASPETNSAGFVPDTSASVNQWPRHKRPPRSIQRARMQYL